MKSLLHSLLALLYVPKCAGCGERMDFRTEEVLCPACKEELFLAMLALCSDCGKAVRDCPCAGRVLPRQRIERVEKLFPYYSGKPEAVTNRVIFRLKHRADAPLLSFLAEVLAERLSPLLPAERGDCLVTYAPRSARAKRRDGHDHMHLLSRAVALSLALPHEKLLLRRGGKEQKGMSGRQRARNMKRAYVPVKHRDLKGKTVILLDDILTTGNTLASAVKALREIGAERFLVATLAITQTEI